MKPMGANNRIGWLSTILRSNEFGLVVSLMVILGIIYELGPPDSFFTDSSLKSLLQQIEGGKGPIVQILFP